MPPRQQAVNNIQALDLENSHRLLESIDKITAVINQKKQGYSKKLGKILDIILDYLGVEQGSIMLLQRKKLVIVAASRPEIIGIKKSLDENSVSCLVAKTGVPEFIKDISKDKRFKAKPYKSQYKTNSLLSAPIKQQDTVLGVINVTDKQGSKVLLQDDITYLLNFSSLIMSLIAQEKLNEELKKRKTTLTAKNKELRRREQLQSELSRMLIHDLKGPLSEVVANLDILSYMVSDENREFLELAQLACDRTVRMASDLGSVAKIEDGQMKLLKEEVDPVSLMEESLTNIQSLAKIKGITLALSGEKNLPTIKLDRVLILRVLQNLLTNGLGYSSPNSKIILGCEQGPKKNQLTFSVQDEGPGLNSADQERIFNKYARLSAKQDTLVGTGLGLYFCKLAVEVHKGKISVKSEKGKGSTFFFTLPL